MEYLQYKDEKETLTLLNGVLNLIINGIPSILENSSMSGHLLEF